MNTQSEISIEAFNVRNAKGFRKYDNWRCAKPYVYMLKRGDYVLYPVYKDKVVGYSSLEEATRAAEHHRSQLIANQQPKVFVVMENSDFTEGRGPMVLHKVFADGEVAHNYVMSKEGIFGSTQRQEPTWGINVSGEVYGYHSYNGYEITAKDLL